MSIPTAGWITSSPTDTPADARRKHADRAAYTASTTAWAACTGKRGKARAEASQLARDAYRVAFRDAYDAWTGVPEAPAPAPAPDSDPAPTVTAPKKARAPKKANARATAAARAAYDAVYADLDARTADGARARTTEAPTP